MPEVKVDVNVGDDLTSSSWSPPALSPSERVDVLTALLDGRERCSISVPESGFVAHISRVNPDVADDAFRYVPRFQVQLDGESPSFFILSTGEPGAVNMMRGDMQQYFGVTEGVRMLPATSPEEAGPYLMWIDSVLDDLRTNGVKVA